MVSEKKIGIMASFKNLKNRINMSLTQLNEILSEYEKIALTKKDLSQKINSLKSEHLNDLNELNSLLTQMENLVGDSKND